MFENIMAFDQFYVARAQGTDLMGADQDAILAKAKAEIDELFVDFYSKKDKVEA